MGILAPLALLALPLLGVIVVLYLLKLRRPTAPVGSLHLWETLIRDREANSLWQRLHVSVLLLLQLLILTLLILALARPWVPSTEVVGQNVVIIVDVSASMGGQDRQGGPTRIQQAKDRARDVVDAMPPGARAMLLSATERVTVVVPSTDDRGRLKSAIDQLVVQAVPGDMSEALELAAAVSARDEKSAVWLVSDGAFPPADQIVESLPATLTFVPVGEGLRSNGATGNQGITALALQKDISALSLFVQVSNSEPVSVSRRIDFLADDIPWTARNVIVGPGDTQEVIIEDVPLGARVVQARFAGVDALQVDDRAWVVNRASVPANVLLVSDENKFLELSLALLPTVKLFKVAPKDYTSDASIDGVGFDLTIFDSTVPSATIQTLPPGGVMLFAPQVSTQLITVTGVLTDPVVNIAPATIGAQSGGGAEDPLLRFVDLFGLHVSSAMQLAPPPWGRTVVASGEDPLLIAGTEAGRNIVVFAFDLRDSDLPLQTAFPLLIRNLTAFLLPLPAGGLAAEVAPGEAVGIPLVSEEVSAVVVEDPLAREVNVAVEAGAERVAYGATQQPGVYYVTQYIEDEIVAQEAFAVNLFSRAESLSTPNSNPALPSSAPVQPAAGGQEDGLFRREMWPVVALVGALVLLLEWLFAQRITIRRAVTEWRGKRSAQRLERMKG